jgi:hypothetical protein
VVTLQIVTYIVAAISVLCLVLIVLKVRFWNNFTFYGGSYSTNLFVLDPYPSINKIWKLLYEYY